ncbi:hypothetical protein CTA2_2753 [Colletotrichum tanaceti]|nr:hypothetical protein CTA2_2753 [Colletotrichum tanaceti]
MAKRNQVLTRELGTWSMEVFGVAVGSQQRTAFDRARNQVLIWNVSCSWSVAATNPGRAKN